MKKLSLTFGLIVFLSLISFAKEKQYQVYGIAFYNLENLFDTIHNNGKYDFEYTAKGPKQWNGQKYWSKIHNMAYVISQMKTKETPAGPAIIGVSEIENETVLKDLVKQPELKKLHLQVVHHDSPDRRGVDVSLLYNPRLFRVLNVTNTPLIVSRKVPYIKPILDKYNQEDYEAFRTRDQMCVTGILGGTDTISVIVNHWPSRWGGAERSSYLRECAAAVSKHIADSVRAVHPNSGVIVMGDLNDDPQDKSAAEVLGGRRDKKDVEEGGFYNPWWSTLDKGYGTLAYRGQWNLFDQIIISDYFLGKEEGRLKFWKNEIFNRDFMVNNEGKYKGYPLRTFAAGVFMDGYSDHFPTQIFLVKQVK